MNPYTTIPPGQFEAELALVRRLAERPPWQRGRDPQDGANHEDVDRGLRAAFRRWTTTDVEPSTEMLAPLWGRVPTNPPGFSDDGAQRAVHHAALVLHLLALGADEGPEAPDFGAASHRAGVAEGRFARLVNTPAPGRLEALGRTFRRFRQAGVRWSTDDLENLLRFLFTEDPKRAVSRWAAGYYRVGAQEEEQREHETAEA